MTEKKSIYTKWWFWVIIASLFFGAVGNLGGNSKPSEETPHQEDLPVEASAEEPEDPLADLLTKETKATDYSIEQKGSYLEITYTINETPWDYTDYVSQSLTHCLVVAKYVFKNTDTTQMRMDMVDEHGAIASYIITKENFNKTPWSDLVFLEGNYDTIVSVFDKFYVESMLMKEIDTSKVMIKDYLKD